MTARRRWLTSGTLAFLLIVVTGYLFWMPYDPTALYRAIPANATLISSHHNLAQRWSQLSTNIWLVPFNDNAEISGQFPQSNTLVSISRLMRLARHETLLAYLPATGGAGQPTWMAASWIGGWSPCVRWALFLGRWTGGQWPGIKNLGVFGGRTMWGLQKPWADGRQLSFACGDGVFMACLSPNPSAILYALMAYDKLTPSMQAISKLRTTLRTTAPDIAWYQWPESTGTEPFTLTGELNQLDDQGLSATIRLQPNPCRQARLADSMNITAVEQALGNLPALVTMLPLTTLQDGLRPAKTNSTWIQEISRILASDWIQQNTNGLVLALFTGEYGGGYGRKPLRMSVPTLMAFIRVRQPANISRMIGRELDLLNARQRLGLIQDPIPLTVGAQTIWTIEITGLLQHTALEAEDRPAYTLVGDWLIVSSQAGSLAKLMQRIQKPENTAARKPADWHNMMATTNTSGLVWLDLDTGGKTIQLALSLWGLSRRTADTPSMPNSVKAARTLLERIRPLQSCKLWMEPDGSNAVVRVEIGPRPKP